MVDVLQRRANFLVDGYYNGYTVETIEADVQQLLAQLSATNTTLQGISLGTDSILQLQNILSEVHHVYIFCMYFSMCKCDNNIYSMTYMAYVACIEMHHGTVL